MYYVIFKTLISENYWGAPAPLASPLPTDLRYPGNMVWHTEMTRLLDNVGNTIPTFYS